ncbi:MAG: YfcE family phosphodiesterase [Candidatus Bathyarchaeota archaeon]|nr:YfcE family phosphodiesterase [Candidatus Termiticorpusculum sp.]
MSMASKIFTLTHDESYRQFGCNALSTILKEFENQINNDVITNTNVEFIHKIRVNSRKIRTILFLFQSSFPKKKYKYWFKEIKAVTKLLGIARDLDVQIVFMQKYIHESPTNRRCLTPLLKNYKNKRNTIQINVVKVLNDFKCYNVLKELSGYLIKINCDSSDDSFDSLSVLEKACWNINYRVESFLKLSKYVSQESAIFEHHEMRIKAKYLRYTLEIFAPLYKNGLKQEIRLMKELQDLLGEIHDYDIWLNNISHYTAELSVTNTTKSSKNELKNDEFKKAVTAFSIYITEHRKHTYNSFVQRWNEAISQNFFENLKKTVNNPVSKINPFDHSSLSDCNIKVAVLSDIHANLHALQMVIQDAEKRGAKLFLNAGDSVGFGVFPNEVLNLLYEKNAINVSGNFDSEIFKKTCKNNISKKIAITYTKKELTNLCRVYLNSFIAKSTIEIAGKKVFMTHASPLSATDNITSNTSKKHLTKIVSNTGADVIIVGHSHEQFHKKVDNVLILNPGSVGRPSDGNPQAAYAMLSFNPLKTDLIRLNYPVEVATKALRKRGMPESFAQMLLSGLPLNTILNDDIAKKQNNYRDWSEIIKAAQELSKVYSQDKVHVNQVRSLALTLFDNLQSVHHLTTYERGLLECATLLHDLGSSQNIKEHNKTSMMIILNEPTLLLTLEERRIIASIARYHRGKLPKTTHYNIATLNKKTVNIIYALSGLLRVADAFDRLHNADFTISTIKIAPKKIILECFSTSDTCLIEQAFNRKKNLFENFFKKEIILVWNKQ